MSACHQLLVIGFGNGECSDDGLGPALARAVEALGLPDVQVESLLELHVEDSLDVLLADLVLFVDATVSGEAPFHLERLVPEEPKAFTAHEVSPAALLGIVALLHDGAPDAYLLTLAGQDFRRFHTGLSSVAQCNLAAALRFLLPLLEARDPTAFRDACQPL